MSDVKNIREFEAKMNTCMVKDIPTGFLCSHERADFLEALCRNSIVNLLVHSRGYDYNDVIVTVYSVDVSNLRLLNNFTHMIESINTQEKYDYKRIELQLKGLI